MTIGKEIITLQLGQGGNTLGKTFWEDVCAEHGLCPNGYWNEEHAFQLEQIDCLFVPGANGRNYVPRCVLLDLDPSTLDSCRCSPYGQIFRPDNFIFGHAGSGNNFARARFSAGIDMKNQTLEAIRHEVEMCDHPVGFQMLGALGGGTGTGFGALLLEQLKDEYPKLIMTNYSIFPGSGITSEAVVEPINAILAGPSLTNFSDITICMDNQRLYDICRMTLKLDSPIMDDINTIMAKVISGLSVSYRFPSKRYVGWQSMKCVLVPSPKLHFFVPGFVPLNSRGVQCYRNFSVQDITYQMLHAPYVIQAPGIDRTDYNGGKYITGMAIYRGFSVPEMEVIQRLSTFEAWNQLQFVPWMPYHFVKSISETPPVCQKISATFLANHTGAQKYLWGNMLKKFRALYRRKAFLHWFYVEGMADDDFQQAEETVRQLVEEYRYCENTAPKDWKPLDENEILHRCIEEEQAQHILDVVRRKVSEVIKVVC